MKRTDLAFVAFTFAACSFPLPAFPQHLEHGASTPTAAPLARLIANQPVPSLLAAGIVVVPYRAEGIRILPVYGEAARAVVPRLGHLHVTLDDASWHWLHADNEPVVVQGLQPGPHHLTLQLADANHHVLDTQVVAFKVPTPRRQE